MKRIFLAFVGMSLLVAGASASMREKTRFEKVPFNGKQEIIGEFTHAGRTFKVVTPPGTEKQVNTRALGTSTPIIKDAPGKQQYYCKDVVGYGQGMPIQGYAVASEINIDNNDYYFYDIITAAPMQSYVKGTKQGNQIVLPMGQTVMDYDGEEDYVLNLGLLQPIITEEGSDIYIWFEYSDDYDSVSYSISPTGTLELQSPKAKYTSEGNPPSYYQFPDYVIGYYFSDDGLWSGYCDVFQAYDEFNFEKVVLPENLPSTTLAYIGDALFADYDAKTGVIVTVYEDKADNALYFQGMSLYLPQTIFKATLNEAGTVASVAPNQYIGIEGGLYFVVTATVFNDQFGEIQDDNSQSATFDVERDANGNIISIKASDSPYYLAFNDDPFYFYPVDAFEGVEMFAQDEFPGVPSTPTDAFYGDYGSMMGANYVFFRLSSFADNGDILDVNKLFYQIFVNGSPVEFEQTTGLNLLEEETIMYYGVKQPTYLVPYTFANDIDLYVDGGGSYIVGLYSEGIDTVGVQAVYIWDGKETRSSLVTIDVETGKQTVTPWDGAGVERISAEEVDSVVYYDLQGRKVNNPGKGLYVKKYLLKDGSSKAVKVLK